MCELCHQSKCPVSCPNFDDEEYAVYHCNECGCALIPGDQAYRIGDKVCCEDCCEKIEVEAIDSQIKAFDEIEKQNKYKELEEAFTVLNAPEWIKISDVLNPKWENKTLKLDNLKTEMSDGVKKLAEDFEKLSEMYGESPVYLPVLNRFKQTKDFSQAAVYAVQLEQEYKREQERKAEEERKRAEAEATKQAESIQNAQEEPKAENNAIMPAAEQECYSVNPEHTEPTYKGRFEVRCTKSQLIALRDYMKSEGIEFKVI